MTATFEPLARSDFIYRFTKLYREERKNLKILNDFTMKIIKDRRRELSEGKESTEILMLDLYLQEPVDGRLMSDEEIRNEMNTMIFGAHDTSKTTIGFACHNLAKYPEIQRRVRKEAKLLFGDDLHQDITKLDLEQLPYIEAFIKETLRMYPPIPLLARKLKSEVTAGGYTFPKDVEVLISPFMIGRNPKYFDDPLVFNPDRFLGLELPPRGYIPFSVGARKCIGGKLAMTSLKISVAKIVLHYSLTLPDNIPEMKAFAELILKPKNGIQLRLASLNENDFL